jgi:hypothetical protein
MAALAGFAHARDPRDALCRARAASGCAGFWCWKAARMLGVPDAARAVACGGGDRGAACL